jgi:NTE family protein
MDDGKLREAAAAKPGPARRTMTGVKTINLALQGGGAHGAFAWGVLDRLLECEHLKFEGVSATSAGAMNAVVLADGLARGGREGARQALLEFWQRVSDAARFSVLQPSPLDRMLHDHSLSYSPAFFVMDLMTRMLSPYQFNPFNINPLRDALAASVDFERVRAQSPVKLFLSATNVRSGKVKLFKNADMSVDAVLASACLPFMFQAVEIDGEAYWDGGYMGNPAIFPVIYDCQSADVVIVHINPMERHEVPTTAHDIMNRINEISFNSSLMREMRAVAFVSRLIDDGQVKDGALKRMLIHAIKNDEYMRSLSVASKMNADWEFLTHLRDVGRKSAEVWLTDNFESVGKQSTVDIRGAYL